MNSTLLIRSDPYFSVPHRHTWRVSTDRSELEEAEVVAGLQKLSVEVPGQSTMTSSSAADDGNVRNLTEDSELDERCVVLTPGPDLRGAAVVSAQGGCISLEERGPAQHPAVHLLGKLGAARLRLRSSAGQQVLGGQLMDAA